MPRKTNDITFLGDKKNFFKLLLKMINKLLKIENIINK